MSLFQPGPYQSKAFSYVVRQARRWNDRLRVSLRELRTVASWSAQILLYPAYVMFQVARLAGTQLRQAIKLGLPKLQSAIGSQAQNTTELTVDTPIQLILQTVREFSFPAGLSVQVVEPTPVHKTRLERPLLGPPSSLSRLWQGSIGATSQLIKTVFTITGLQLSPQNQRHLAQVSTGDRLDATKRLTCIQGIACLLETRALILVTDRNQILDILTTEQQAQLDQRITWQIAHYGRYLTLRRAARQLVDRLNLSRAEPVLSVPLHPFTMWLKSEPVQQVRTSIQQIFEIALLSLGWRGRPQLTESANRLTPSSAALELAVDSPLQQILRAAQEVASAELLASLTQEVVQQPALEIAHTTESVIYVHGVASLLETRAIVLVTNQNQVLDILTAEQQKHLRQRISWEVAIYYRQLHRRSYQTRRTLRWVAQLRPFALERPILPPIRAFQNLMVWMQTSPVAIAANLFQEASLVVAAELTADRLTWQTAAPLGLVSEGASPVLDDTWVPALSPATQPTTATSQLSAPTARAASSAPQHAPDYIDIQATLLGYMQTPLEKFFRWLDRLILWLEEQLASIWKSFFSK